MIRVLVADDHAVVRKGLSQIISETIDMEVVAEVGTSDEIFRTVRKEACDVVVLDLDLGETSGVEVLRVLGDEFPKLPVLILSVHSEQQYAVRMLRSGASGYLNKDSAPEQLVLAIRRVADGHRFMSAAVAEQLLSRLDSDNEGPLHSQLSDREFQVMRMLSSGKAVSEIADALSISVKTVSTYRSRVLQKMDMKNNAELTHYAIKNNLVL